jgi:hypothetical protein
MSHPSVNPSFRVRDLVPRLSIALNILVASSLLGSVFVRAQSQPTQSNVPVSPAGAFVDSIGINVHFNYYGSIYTNQTPLILTRLQQLGIRHLRDALCWQGNTPKNTYYLLHQQLGDLGYKTDYVAYINQPTSQIATYPSLVNDMEAIEPANEYDISGDPAWVAHITAQQAALYSTIRAVAPHVTVLAPSLAYPSDAPFLGNISHITQAGNLHGYFGGNNPANAPTLVADMKQNTPNQPTWVTESGYFAAAGPAFGSYGVTPAIQAVYSPRLLLDYWNSGVTHTYLYELADDLEAGENAAQYHWGLLDNQAKPKPAFNALSTLIQLLGDPTPPSAAAFVPTPLPLTIQASSPTVRYTLFEKRDGSYYLALWNEVPSYNPVSGQQLTPATQTVTLHLARTVLYNGVQQFDAAGNVTTHLMLPTQTLTLPVTDKLQILTWILH